MPLGRVPLVLSSLMNRTCIIYEEDSPIEYKGLGRVLYLSASLFLDIQGCSIFRDRGVYLRSGKGRVLCTFCLCDLVRRLNKLIILSARV